MIFLDNTLKVVQNALLRANILSEDDRLLYSRKLLDFYRGFSRPYIVSLIEKSVTSVPIQNNMINLIMPYPLLQNFIDEISGVYLQQPQRRFYVDGKLVVDKVNPDQDPARFYVDAKLLETLNGIYTRKFNLTIKKAEALTNLFSTTIFKLNYRNKKYCLDFIPNDAVTIDESVEDPTQMDRILFVKYFDQETAMPIYEDWTPLSFKLVKGESTLSLTENRAAEELVKIQSSPYNDAAFPPFVVFRANLAVDDFWDMHDKDVIDVIEQILLAYTELRYLQRYGAFGLKYVIGAELPEDKVIDLLGILEIKPQSNLPPGQTPQVSAGEFANTARIQELSSSIFEMMKLLYDLYGINIDRLVASKQATTAESKQQDRKTLQEYIQGQQEIWQVNEENLFTCIQAVYNRDHTEKLPKNLTMTIDFPEAVESAQEMLARLEANMVKIQNNVMNMIQWMQEENPDLSDEEAQTMLQKNKQINDDLIVTPPTQVIDPLTGQSVVEEALPADVIPPENG